MYSLFTDPVRVKLSHNISSISSIASCCIRRRNVAFVLAPTIRAHELKMQHKTIELIDGKLRDNFILTESIYSPFRRDGVMWLSSDTLRFWKVQYKLWRLLYWQVFFGVGRVAGFDGPTTLGQTSNGVPSLLKKRSLLFSCMGCLVTGILGLKLAGEAALKGPRGKLRENLSFNLLKRLLNSNILLMTRFDHVTLHRRGRDQDLWSW